MPLPEGFNEFEFLQDTLRRVHNGLVREEFSDLGGDDWEADITVGRGALRHACTMKDEDTGVMETMRMWLFYVMLRKAADFQPAIYSIPIQDYQETFRYHPQIKLFFMEDAQDTDDSYRPLRSEITFRLMGETEKSITEADARRFAEKIRTNFTRSGGFHWKRSKETWIYHDSKKGYRLKLFVWDEAEAKRVIEQVLDIQGHTPDWDEFLKDATNRKDLKTTPIPKTETIYGKKRRLPRNKPVGSVRFRWAELYVWGLPNPITLVDRTGYRHKPLLIAY